MRKISSDSFREASINGGHLHPKFSATFLHSALPQRLASAFASTSSFTTSIKLRKTAWNRAVLPFESWILVSAFLSRRKRTASTWFNLTAQCRGVSPLLFVALTSAPESTRIFAISINFWRMAMCKHVSLSFDRWLRFAR
eukprot:Pompholyxophrys_punicea_v1_NODE_954_length_1101_cov_2.695029.p2 type:complete len:140 gc:universal NODE_954_length_1101_cov_2.695029:56-475(+)